MTTDPQRALRELLAAAAPVGSETVPLPAAAGRVAAQEVTCWEPVPHFRRAAMDGYVVWTEDLATATPEQPIRLRVTGSVRMGEPPASGPARGEAWSIPTGGALPQRGDRVLPLEQVQRQGAFILVSASPSPKPNVAEPGEDLLPGTLLLRPGEIVHPGILGALIACGLTSLEVYRRPRVALLSTGDELTEESGPLPPGRTRNLNGPLLAAELREAGCAVELLGTFPDRPEVLAAAFRQALTRSYDVILSTGGVSVGAQDQVPPTWQELGAQPIVGRLTLKPGGPLFAGRVGSSWVIGLSGSPAACLATYHLLVRPLLRRLGGHRWTVRPLVRVPLAGARERTGTHLRALWATLGSDPPTVAVLETGGTLSEIARANSLVLLPAGTPPLRDGSCVPVLCLRQPEDRADLSIPPVLPAPLVVGVTGASGSGKTTAIEGLLQRFQAAGIAAAAIKHAAHGFTFDRPGSDSDRLAQAGARAVLVAGPEQLVLRLTVAPTLDRLLALLATATELLTPPPAVVFVEGFHHPDRPLIQVGPGKEITARPWIHLPALTELDLAQREQLLDDLAVQVHTWLAGDQAQRPGLGR
ncbi:MAG: hypothetical protein KatS3mg061_0708 [Dehalococcoidia bacterium]|nr:MAG: hypothetical protein KatS3mg061_0708 [Dehalococcoidia bacterium]